MAEQWKFIDTREGDSAWNMAYDELALQEAESSGTPMLRFYAWSEPAATFGYFQRIADVESMTSLRPLIRRCTGGGLVPHASDWTYSLAIPTAHPWYRLKAVESYRRAHEWLRRAFGRLGVETSLAECCDEQGPGQCFLGAEKYDLIRGGRKLAGAAQRRMKSGLLIQGSLQPGEVSTTRESWRDAMLATVEAEWAAFKPDAVFEAEVWRVARSKYGSDEHNRRR